MQDGAQDLVVDYQRAPLQRVAQRPMGVAVRWLCVAGAEDLRLRRGRREDKQRRQRGAPHQICFSGICTTSPSSASVTLSWQVRRERAGSGS